jgi:WD40 repeat protein
MRHAGDDDGVIKVWDTRQRQCVYTFDDVHEDFVADMEWNADSQELISVSGDGTLAIHSLKRGKLVAQSDNQEDELLSCCLVKGGKKVSRFRFGKAAVSLREARVQ